MVNPERAAFIRTLDLMGMTPLQISKRISEDDELTPITEAEVHCLMTSDLYIRERSSLLEAFRRHAIKSAVDTLLFANQQAAEFMVDAMHNLAYKPNTRLAAAREILDRIPQTSKTLRQYIGDNEHSPITEDQLLRMTGQLKIDRKAMLAIEEGFSERSSERSSGPKRENLGQLIDNL